MGRKAKIKKARKTQNTSGLIRLVSDDGKVITNCYLFEVWNILSKKIRPSLILSDFYQKLDGRDLEGICRCFSFLNEYYIEKSSTLPWAAEYGDSNKCSSFYCLLDDLINGMIDALMVDVKTFYDFSFLSDQEKYKNIGMQLNDLGGFSLMFEACNFLPAVHQKEIDCCWDGIGAWRY